jgi:hypothetical protein
MVDIFLKFADAPHSHGLVGKQLTSIIVPRQPELTMEFNYHSNVAKTESFAPDLVYVKSDLRLNVLNASIKPVDADPALWLSGPKLKPNQLCWCGSGEKYKRCHGRKSKNTVPWGFVAEPDKPPENN